MDTPPPQHPAGGALLPPPPPPPPAPGTLDTTEVPRARRRGRGRLAAVIPLLVIGAVLGVLLGGRASAEDGRAAAAAALAGGDPARAVSLYESLAARSGLLMVLDPGAASSAAHQAQVARIAWARQLASGGRPDAAVAVLAQVSQPSLLAEAAQARAQILMGAATAAVKAGQAQLALRRLDEALHGTLPGTVIQLISATRAETEVAAAREDLTNGHAADAPALLDDASGHGAAGKAAPLYPAALLAAAQQEMPVLDYVEAAANLQRLVSSYGSSPEAGTAQQLLAAPQPVSGTLVDAAGHGAGGRVRLSTHFIQLPGGGYVTNGPFYTGMAAPSGDFTIPSVPVGGPYVLEYFRDGDWMTLVDPRTDQPANPVTVKALQPEDLTFIVLPA